MFASDWKERISANGEAAMTESFPPFPVAEVAWLSQWKVPADKPEQLNTAMLLSLLEPNVLSVRKCSQ